MAQLLVDKAVLEKELELVKKTSASSRVSSAISTRLKWLTRYAASFRYLCCLLLLILRHQASTTNSNSDLLRIRTRISAKCFMRLVLSRNFTYGYRRLWRELRHRGIVISEKVVRRLMHEEGIRPWLPKRKWRYSSYQGEISPAPPNLGNRNFHAEHPNRLRLTDISVFATN